MAKSKKRIGDNGNMSDALKNFIDANRLQKGLDKVSIEDAWHSVMGNAISKYTTAIKLDREILYVQLSSFCFKRRVKLWKNKNYRYD